MTLNHETLGKKNFQNNGLMLKENLDWFVLGMQLMLLFANQIKTKQEG